MRADGSNLHDIVDAARDHILDAGFAWFATLDGVDRMLNVARHEPLTRYTAAGMGNLGSPHRLELIAALEGARR